jgi:hypothetical protein
MNGRDFAIALVVVLLLAGVTLFLLGGTARASFREIARTTNDTPDADLAPSEPTG